MANNARIVNHPGRSVFDLSYTLTAPMDMGILYPVMCDEAVPGDSFKLGADVLLRAQPMVAPLMHEVNIYLHSYFVPYRVLWDRWQDFITGGSDGQYFDKNVIDPPRFYGTVSEGSLGDFLGFPIGSYGSGNPHEPSTRVTFRSGFPFLAYNAIWNWYYRDENFQPERPYVISDRSGASYLKDPAFNLDQASGNFDFAYRSWEKDYFTSALPWRQRGIEPRIPIYSSDSGSSFLGRFYDFSTGNLVPAPLGSEAGVIRFGSNFSNSGVTTSPPGSPVVPGFAKGDGLYVQPNDIRLAMQIQRWMERNARAGIRYNEFIKSHFGVDIQDYRLQQPEYIGGCKQPLIVSEVLQTSETGNKTPQGNLAGHGVSVGSHSIGSYFVREYGLIMTLMSIMPKPAYHQGLNRQWTRRFASDYYFPEFANLPEQAILNKEIFYSGDGNMDSEVFGYQGRFDEMRIKYDRIAGALHSSLNFWTIFRNFDKSVKLNSSFLQCKPSKSWLAVPSEPAFIVSVGNRIRAVRPLPEVAVPGLIDHN